MTGSAAEPDLIGLRRVAEQVAREAAALLRGRRTGEVTVAARKSSVVDVVTEADRASEELLRARLAEVRPEDGFLGEEGGRRDGASGVTWVVDPLDGTVNYLYGLPHYAVSVAALDASRSVLAGAVVDVGADRCYSAARGGGASCDGRPLAVRPVPPRGERLVLTGFQYQQHVRAVQGAAVARLLPQVRDVRRLGSAALDLCLVAEGRADAYVEEGPQLWDHAAGGLVAQEAGARVALLPGAGGMECVVAAPAEGFDDLLDLARECGFLSGG